MKHLRVSLFALLPVLAACGDGTPAGPGGFSRIPCRPPVALVAMVVGVPFAPSAMHSALRHAADQMTLALGTSADVQSLRHAITVVSIDIAASDRDGACRLLTIAYDTLRDLPQLPATLPDRDGIRLILALTAQSLDAAMGE